MTWFTMIHSLILPCRSVFALLSLHLIWWVPTPPSRSYNSCLCYLHWQQQKPVIRRKHFARKAQKFSTGLSKRTSKVAEKKEGTVAGAVALIIGTSIGTGILALPEKAFPAVLPFLWAEKMKKKKRIKIFFPLKYLEIWF